MFKSTSQQLNMLGIIFKHATWDYLLELIFLKKYTFLLPLFSLI